MIQAFDVEPPIGAHLQALDAHRALATLAGRQHAVIARRQLVALGFGRHAIEHLIDRYRLHAVHRGVYAVGHARLTRRGRWMAAVLAAGPDAVLSHRSAGALHEVCADRGREVEVSRSASCRQRPGIRIHFGRLERDEVTSVDGIPVTTAARTLLDLAAVVSLEQVERAMDAADVRRLGDTTSLAALIERYPRRRGTHNLRTIRAAHVASIVTRSVFEERFIAFLVANGLPPALVNHQIPDIGECDVVWPQARLIVELDGYATHGTRRSFEADRARDRALQVAGWRVIRITWRQLADHPQRLAADLRTLLAGAGR